MKESFAHKLEVCWRKLNKSGGLNGTQALENDPLVLCLQENTSRFAALTVPFDTPTQTFHVSVRDTTVPP
jgi:hypothetical protein